jgi:hypothetical protein
MDKKYIKSYKNKLYEQSLKEVTERLDIKGEKFKLLLQLVIGAILTGIAFALGFLGIAKYDNLQNAIYSAIWIGALTPALIIFIGMVFGARIMARSKGNIFRIAAQQDFEQKKTIEKLSSQNEKIIIEKFNYYDQSNTGEFKTGIVIHNQNSIPFTDITIELIETNWRKLDSEGNIFLTERIGVLADNSHFNYWANGKRNSVAPKDKETIYFHQIENGIAVAMLENRKEPFEQESFSPEGNAISFIEIIFEVRGKIGDDFFDKRYSQLIKYTSSKIKSDPNDTIIRISTIDCHSVLICENDVTEIVKANLAQ